ncbi:myotubularin-related protein 6 isoform X2 [Odontomachus brunneus]|uniref:myotubularin-related protein 6 isoform X2 n=1 Tax=Odontomachus brunneus TaxID=486640 RepID=UPI0013F2822A|nr:myotubularin-related protein 6 isoform X2 [Odontomachus brunneus]
MEQIKIPKVENVRMLDKYSINHSVGTLYLTVTHLIFVERSGKKKMWVLYTHISNIEKQPLTTRGSPLYIKCKHFFITTFVIPKERDCHEIYLTLLKLSCPASLEELYCFTYQGSEDTLPRHAGWNFFNVQSEFQRQGVPNEEWSLSYLNSNYELCDTYPRYLYVPSKCTNNVLLGSAKFRSRGRLPVLTYLHSNKAAICRCSQPLSGFSARCPEDEEMMYNILCTNPNSRYMYVVDTRPRINAFANKAAGKGYENENFYDNIKFHFFGIENIHVMRTSLNKLMDLQRSTSMSAFLSGLESSGWLKHIRSILETAWFIARAVSNGVSVVVHCSDGWDRTAQVCSLAALLLDPFYRTIQGFQALIEKDWLSFGHKFSDRCGYVSSDGKELAPVFTQFIDATYQLLRQYPYKFQFNEYFLLTLHDHVHSCQHGTFIGNSEKERQILRLSERTYSLWGYLANNTNEYINPIYRCNRYNTDDSIDVLQPKLAPQSIVLWRGLYFRFENGVHPRESCEDLLLTIYDHTSSLEDHVKLLLKRVNSLGQLLNSNNTQKKGKHKFDNKFMETLPKAIIENTANHDEKAKLKTNQLENELRTVALEWKSSRNMEECGCSTTFDAFNKKHHCWSCGYVLCTRCMAVHAKLPGHLSQRAVPTCKSCYQSSAITSASQWLRSAE